MFKNSKLEKCSNKKIEERRTWALFLSLAETLLPSS
jgi:hypothetical protein